MLNRICLFSGLLLALFFIANVAIADTPTAKELISSEKRMTADKKRLIRRFQKLSASDKVKVLASRSGKSDDSDSDGVPNNLEGSSGTCKADSDDDGINDGDEYEDGTSPDDSDSDDDGVSDNLEIEVRGLIASISSSALSVSNTNFVLNESTIYRGRKNETLTNSDFAVGDCVEAEGHSSGGVVTAKKVKKDNDC